MSELKPCMKCSSGDVGASQGKAYCYQCGITTKQHVTNDNAVKDWNTRDEAPVKREGVNELLALHKQDRAKVNSQCDSLINMSTVDKYLRSLG